MPKDLKLIEWVEDGCPPIDLNKKPELVVELVTEIRRLRDIQPSKIDPHAFTTVLAMCSVYVNDLTSEIILKALGAYNMLGGEFSLRDSSKIVCDVEAKYKAIAEESNKEKK